MRSQQRLKKENVQVSSVCTFKFYRSRCLLPYFFDPLTLYDLLLK